jgi:hypothetical protein
MKEEYLFLARCKCGCVMVQKRSFIESYWTHNPQVVEKCPVDLESARCPECLGDDAFPIRD